MTSEQLEEILDKKDEKTGYENIAEIKDESDTSSNDHLSHLMGTDYRSSKNNDFYNDTTSKEARGLKSIMKNKLYSY